MHQPEPHKRLVSQHPQATRSARSMPEAFCVFFLPTEAAGLRQIQEALDILSVAQQTIWLKDEGVTLSNLPTSQTSAYQDGCGSKIQSNPHFVDMCISGFEHAECHMGMVFTWGVDIAYKGAGFMSTNHC